MRAVEIFSGVGGLALGVSQAGFVHDIVIERDEQACQTIKSNQQIGVEHVSDWPIYEGDIQTFDFSTIGEGLDLLCGGPPCQPFSLAGKSLGKEDKRDMFPQAIRAVRELRPKAFVFENVGGFLRPNHLAYAEYVRLQLSCPQIDRKPRENWESHRSRLEKCFTGGRTKDEIYHVLIHPVNAADYGVPQRRIRVFIVGIRADLEAEWSFPAPTHSRDQLLISKFITGDYWEEYKIPRRKRAVISKSLKSRLHHVHDNDNATIARWVTIRDSFADLPRPSKTKKIAVSNHTFIPGARAYAGHTGSFIDEPAKTLKAGVHGVPGGENMLIHGNGRVRYFTVREKARLQTFPDEFQFNGNWTATTRHLGNAVPVLLSSVIAKSIARLLVAKKKT